MPGIGSTATLTFKAILNEKKKGVQKGEERRGEKGLPRGLGFL